MKKRPAIAFAAAILAPLMAMIFLFPAYFAVKAEGETEYTYPVGGANAYPKIGYITVYDETYGERSGGKEEYDALEIVVAEGKITAVGGVDNAIPQGGFVAMARGSAIKKKLQALDPQVGDTVIFDRYNMEILFIGESYSPFYEHTIRFDRYNSTRTEDTIIIYNQGETTKTNIWGVEAVVDERGFVASFGGNDNAIPEGGFVISAVGRGRIAELTEAAALGLYVTVDDSKKTITFAFAKESVAGGMEMEYQNFQADVLRGKEVFAILDYRAIETVDTQMKTCLERAKTALLEDDIAGAMVEKYRFAEYLRSAEVLTVEYPAVEARGMWLRPFHSENREKVNAVVKAVHDAGYNAICIELLYNSVTIFPIDTEEYLFSQDKVLKGFDVLAAYIDECHKYGMELYGWMPCYRVGYATSTNNAVSVATQKPEWLCKAKSGTVEVGDTRGYFLNPALPEVNEFLLKFYRYIFENYALDGFQMDYIRYPHAAGEEFGYDDRTLSAFESEYGENPKDFTKAHRLWEPWCRFRAKYVTDFVTQIANLARDIRPDMYLAADLTPDFRDTYVKYMQESEIWLKTKLIDAAFPMAYGTNVVPLYASFTISAAGDGAYSYIGLGDYGVDILKREIIESREAGADGFAFFSWSQYESGKYADEIASTILSKPALPPSFSAKDALLAQGDYLLQRLDAIRYIDQTALPKEAEDLIKNAAASMAETLKTQTATLCAAALKEAGKSLSKIEMNAAARDALLSDLLKAQKIAALSKDAQRQTYYESHPLPERYAEESSEDEGSGETESEETPSLPGAVSGGQGEENPSAGPDNLILYIALAAAGAVTAAAIAYFLRKRKSRS